MLDEKNKEKKLQKLYSQFQVLDQNIKQIQQQAQTLNTQLVELVSATQSLEELKNVKPGTEILVPISAGVYAKAEIKDSKNMLVNVGANTNVKKSVSDTKKIIEIQVEEMKKLQKQMLGELNQLTTQAGMIENEMNRISSG
jgi:prefoldin alpha subunit